MGVALEIQLLQKFDSVTCGPQVDVSRLMQPAQDLRYLDVQ